MHPTSRDSGNNKKNSNNKNSELDLIFNNKSAENDGKMHVLYSCGRMSEDSNEADYFESLKKIAELTRRTTQRVEETILNGQRKKIKSSLSLKKLVQLIKLKELGLDVYIEVEPVKV